LILNGLLAGAGILPLLIRRADTTLSRVNRLTKKEQLVLCIVLGLLLIGWAAKAYRAAHPPPLPIEQSHP